MSRNPTVKITFECLPADAKERHEALIDLFGQHVFWMRNHVGEKVEQLLQDPELRKKLGRIPAEPYEQVATLGKEVENKAKALARAAVDQFIREMMSLLMNRGVGTKLGEDHCIKYELNLEIHRIPKDEEFADGEREPDTLVEYDTINIDGRRAFSQYFGTWILRHEKHK
jgi:hypothetical protein